ncbi:MAG: hypothetical protein ACLFQM_04055 [Fidelibacterota bacterium]
MTIKRLLLISLLCISLAGAQSFNTDRFAIGLKVGSLGGGGDLTMRIINPLNVRVGSSFFSFAPDLGEAGTTEEYTMDATINLQAIYTLLDYYPFKKSGFHLSTGLYISANTMKSDIYPQKTYTIGGDEYTPEKLGDVSMDLNMDGTCPYIGFGFGNRLNGRSGFGMTLDMGGYYQGAPEAKMSATGLVEPTASADQEKMIEESLAGLTWYPVVSFGINYKF